MKNAGQHTAIPYLILLALIIIAVMYSDRLAHQVSNEPIRIQLMQSSSNEGDVLWQFEQEFINESVSIVRHDSLYKEALQFYQNRKFKSAENRFLQLMSRYHNSPDVLNNLGLIEMRKPNLVGAMNYFQQCLELDSNNIAALVNLGILYTRLENYKKADSLYTVAISRNPNRTRPLLNKGIMHCKVGEWIQAKSTLDDAVEISSGDQKSKALAYRGMAQFNLGQLDTAKSDFQESINLKPDYILPRIYLAISSPSPEMQEEELRKVIALRSNYAPAHFYLGVVLHDQGKITEAQNSFEHALQLNPIDRDITNLLGSFYIENDLLERAQEYFGVVYSKDSLSPQNFFYKAKIASRQLDNSQAIDFYEKAIEQSDGNYAEAFLNKGIIQKKEGNVDLAIASYKKAIQLRDNYEDAWYNLALAHRSLGQNEEAAKCYKKAIDINPRAIKARYNLGFIYKDSDDVQGAMALWQEITEMDSSFSKAWYNLGLAYSQLNDFSSAISIYNTLLERFPRHSKGWYNLAIAQKESGLKEEAILSYERAIDLDPTYIAAWKNLGSLHAQIGNTEEAINQFQQAVDLDHTDPQLRFNLAIQYERQGNMDEALLQLNKAVQLKPDYLKAIQKLKDIAAQKGDEVAGLRAESLLRNLDGDAELTYELGRSFHKKNLYNEAISEYNKAIDRGKQGYWVVYWKGKALEESGRISEAKSTYLSALELNDTHKFSLYRMYLICIEDVSPSGMYKDKLIELYPEFALEKNIK